MIFAEICNDVYRRLNKPIPPDPLTAERVKSYINQRHRTLLTMPGLNQLRYGRESFTSVPTVARVALSQSLNRVDAIFDPTNGRRLEEKSLDWVRSVDPQYNSGTPTVYIPLGYQYVHTQPLTTEVWAVGGGSDIGVISVEGTRATGPLSESRVPMLGATPVQIGTFATWTSIAKVFISQPAVSPIFIGSDAAMTIPYATITIGKQRPYYFVIQLWPLPSAEITYVVDYTRKIEEMVADTDEPYLPEDFHDLLSIGARMDEYEKTNDGRYKAAQMEWREKYNALQYFLQARASARLIPRGMGGRTGWNNVSGWCAADEYF